MSKIQQASQQTRKRKVSHNIQDFQSQILGELNQYQQNLNNCIVDSQLIYYEYQNKTPQILVHEVESLGSQQKIQQMNQYYESQDKAFEKGQKMQNAQSLLIPQTQNDYQIKINQVQSSKSINPTQMNDYTNSCDQLIIFQGSLPQTGITLSESKHLKQDQVGISKKQLQAAAQFNLVSKKQNKQNIPNLKNKSRKTYFQTRYHPQKIPLKKQSFQVKIQGETNIQTQKLDVKMNKDPLSIFRKQNKNSGSNANQIKRSSAINADTKIHQQKLINKSSNKKTLQKISPLIMNRPKIRQSFYQEPQISLQGPIQKMKQILEDRNYNTCQNQKENNRSLNRKIIKKSPYGLIQIILRKQKKQSILSKITNLRILKPGQLKKINKKSRIKCLDKTFDDTVETYGQCLPQQK